MFINLKRQVLFSPKLCPMCKYMPSWSSSISLHCYGVGWLGHLNVEDYTIEHNEWCGTWHSSLAYSDGHCYMCVWVRGEVTVTWIEDRFELIYSVTTERFPGQDHRHSTTWYWQHVLAGSSQENDRSELLDLDMRKAFFSTLQSRSRFTKLTMTLAPLARNREVYLSRSAQNRA